MLDPEEVAKKVTNEIGFTNIALVFGREDSGLSNEELQLGNFHVQIPAEEKYSSLNLAAAVLVICYEIPKKRLVREILTKKTKILKLGIKNSRRFNR